MSDKKTLGSLFMGGVSRSSLPALKKLLLDENGLGHYPYSDKKMPVNLMMTIKTYENGEIAELCAYSLGDSSSHKMIQGVFEDYRC